MQHIDNVIIGGGPVGLITAFNLAKLGYLVTIFDMGNFAAMVDDGKVLSLSYASVDYIKSIGINIPNNILTPIKEVHISHNGFGISKISAKLLEEEQLGYTIKYIDLYQIIYQQVQSINNINFINQKVTQITSHTNYTLITYTDNDCEIQLKANQLIMAEGGNLTTNLINYKHYDYNQVAIVSKIKGSICHNNIAYERFDKDGVMALLPYSDHYILIFSVLNTKKEFFLDLDNYKSFLLKHNFIKKIGDFEFMAPIKYFPLKLKIAQKRVINNIILMGSSAQIINPVAAQGLNLSIRDIKYLMQIVEQKGIFNINTFVDEYDKIRTDDVKFVKYFTHMLSTFINCDNFFINNLKVIGILGLENILLLKKYITNKLIFGSL